MTCRYNTYCLLCMFYSHVLRLYVGAIPGTIIQLGQGQTEAEASPCWHERVLRPDYQYHQSCKNKHHLSDSAAGSIFKSACKSMWAFFGRWGKCFVYEESA